MDVESLGVWGSRIPKVPGPQKGSYLLMKVVFLLWKNVFLPWKNGGFTMKHDDLPMKMVVLALNIVFFLPWNMLI